jgi:catechol 2,3-dioxygenase-like lactoylglutathione lyase family enzyme
MRFDRVALAAPADRGAALAEFYGDTLGFELVVAAERITLALGETTLELGAGDGAPFYHFALLVPGDRFDAALAWAAARIELLSDPESRGLVFDFDAWEARACYFLDPADNVVELIAHRGIGEAGARGAFAASELLGLSELGLVGEPAVLACALSELGLEVWDGTVSEPGRLAFVGGRGRTLILAPPGRGWLPTGQPAEAHPVEAVLATPRAGEVELEGGRYRITSLR